MLSDCQLILFDLDGTLVDSAPDLCAALSHALREFGMVTHDVPAVRQMIGEGQRVLIERAIRRAGGDLDRLDDVLRSFRRYYSEHLVDTTTLYPGVAETLQALSPRLPLAVATNKPGDWARRIVDSFGLRSHFRWVLGEDDVGARKPDPRLLLTLCERAGVAASATLMVGDSAIDLAAAAAANMPVAFCTYGFSDEETRSRVSPGESPLPLGSAGRPFLISQMPDLLALLPA
jgi:phosphoglycolate phosphatase